MLHEPALNAERGPITEIAAVFASDDDESTADEHEIGRLAIHEDGSLSLVEASPAHAKFLNRVMDRVNAKPALAWPSDGPLETPQDFGTRAEMAKRGEPGFNAALRDYVGRYYGLRLA